MKIFAPPLGKKYVCEDDSETTPRSSCGKPVIAVGQLVHSGTNLYFCSFHLNKVLKEFSALQEDLGGI